MEYALMSIFLVLMLLFIAVVEGARWKARCLAAEVLLWDYEPEQMIRLHGSYGEWKRKYCRYE